MSEANRMNQRSKNELIALGVSMVAGGSFGMYVGDTINEYVELLRQAPPEINFHVNVATTYFWGKAGLKLGRLATSLSKMYRRR